MARAASGAACWRDVMSGRSGTTLSKLSTCQAGSTPCRRGPHLRRAMAWQDPGGSQRVVRSHPVLLGNHESPTSLAISSAASALRTVARGVSFHRRTKKNRTWEYVRSAGGEGAISTRTGPALVIAAHRRLICEGSFTPRTRAASHSSSEPNQCIGRPSHPEPRRRREPSPPALKRRRATFARPSEMFERVRSGQIRPDLPLRTPCAGVRCRHFGPPGSAEAQRNG